jgi:hypothetical protein
MTLAEFKIKVEGELPFALTELLIFSKVDNIIAKAIADTLMKYEKIETTEINDTQVIERAQSVMEVVPSVGTDQLTVFQLDKSLSPYLNPRKIGWKFEPSQHKLYLELYHERTTTVTVKYVVEPEFLTVEDLDSTYIEWAAQYAASLIMIAEGRRGSFVSLPATGLEYDYQQMKQEYTEERDKLLEQLEEMYYGLFAIRH